MFELICFYLKNSLNCDPWQNYPLPLKEPVISTKDKCHAWSEIESRFYGTIIMPDVKMKI